MSGVCTLGLTTDNLAHHTIEGAIVRPDDSEPRYVLLVEADAAHAGDTERFLAARGMDVTHVGAPSEARQLAARAAFDVVVLDVSGDRRSGLRLLAEISERPELPVLITSDLDDLVDRIEALDGGADDYLAKPFDLHELLARMRAIHRRYWRAQARARQQKTATFEGWTLDLDSREAVHAQRPEYNASLTEGEFHLLLVLLQHAGETLTRERLASMTHRDASEVFHRSIDVLVGRLRRKLESPSPGRPIIQTVRGEGYRMPLPVFWQ